MRYKGKVQPANICRLVWIWNGWKWDAIVATGLFSDLRVRVLHRIRHRCFPTARSPMFRFLFQSAENEELTLKAQTGNMEKRELIAPSSRVIKVNWKTTCSRPILEEQMILKGK